MTSWSGGYGPRFKGNSFLLQIKPYRYVVIRTTIFEFTIPNKDIIKDYYSPVGNNDVSYPIAIGKINLYFIAEKQYIPLKDIPKPYTNPDLINGYEYLYNHSGKYNNLKNKFKRLKTKEIHGRMW